MNSLMNPATVTNRHEPSRQFALMGWLAIEALQVMAQLRMANHHFVPLLVPMVLLCVITFAGAWRFSRLFAIACFAIGMYPQVPMIGAHMLASLLNWQQLTAGNWPVQLGEPIQAEVGAYLRERTTPADRIHVQGNDHPDTFGIYWESRRRPAVYLYYNSEVSPRVFDLQEQSRTLAIARPTYIVVMLKNPLDPLRGLLEREYFLERSFWGSGRAIDCWRRRG